MSNPLLFLLILGLFLFCVLSYYLAHQIRALRFDKKREGSQEVLLEWLKDMRGSMDKNLGVMTDQMRQQQQALNERLDNAARVVGSVSKELGQMSEIGRQIKDLQDFMRSPKLRGNLGEQILRDLLEQVIPHSNFALQYSFHEGKTVDAIIKTDRGLIPIDSKFPLESFSRVSKAESEEEKDREMKQFVRAVKKHIDDISGKYILPQEGTVDFALMYVPSEPIYYEMVMNDQDLNAYAHQRKVLIVSPNSFYYFLRVVMMGLQEKRIAEGARAILATLDGINHETHKFGEDLGVLYGHINRTKGSMDTVMSRYQSLAGKVDSVKHLKEREQLPDEVDSL